MNNERKRWSTIMERLKQDTEPFHRRLESLPFFQALADHVLPLESYIGQLKSLSVIHAVLEKEIAGAEDEQVASVWGDRMKKLPFLEDDLRYFNARALPDLKKAVEASLAMAERIRLRRVEDPVSLLGYLYVLEGSTLGNLMHRPDVTAAFGLDSLKGCRYYAGYQDQEKRRWGGFSNSMNRALADPLLHDPVNEAAREAFSGLEDLYTALYPTDGEPRTRHATGINPEAGSHPMPTDEREIEAALNASDRLWAASPYFEHRYGARGKRFSDSDACWLVTLRQLEPQEVQRQIDWIGRVLAARGMPTILLEQTLRLLFEELAAAAPENKGAYAKLVDAAEALCEARARVISEETARALSSDFELALKADPAAGLQHIAGLLVAAVADEKNGMKGAVSALKESLTDPGRFPKKWISAVNETIRRAEQAAAWGFRKDD
jgi:heme oxygenase